MFGHRFGLKMSGLVAFCVLMCAAVTGLAQETTGRLEGTVSDTLRQPLPFVNVVVTNQETGFAYGAMSDKTGYFIFPQLPPDPHYTVAFRFVGYREEVVSNVVVDLGKTTKLTVALKEDVKLISEVVISSSGKELLKKNAMIGNEVTLSEGLINRMPTRNRSIQDITNAMSESNMNSFGGASARFNNLSIDGSNANDVLGFQESVSGASGSLASGTPGAMAASQPIGFGAIKSISVKQTPFDVSSGNFTGASMNVVTRNGTNTFRGESYSFVKHSVLTGRYSAGVRQERSQFANFQNGVSFGGPILKNKLFFFTNIEFAYRTENLLNAPGSSGSLIPLNVVQQISDTLQSRYRYDPGVFQNGSIDHQSTKVFLRFDYAINRNNSLIVRANFVDGFADQLEWTANSFNFGNQGYRHSSSFYNVVAELKTTLSDKVFNTLTVSHNRVNDGRSFEGDVFPHLEISYNTTNRIFAGTYREAAVYGATLNTTQINDKLSYYRGKHAVSLGFAAELNAIEYRFLTAFNGRWQYNSVDDFFNDTPVRIRGVYNIQNNDYDFNTRTPSADFSVALGGVYLQDEVRLTSRLKVLAGVRADFQYIPQVFPLSEEISRTDAFANYTNTPNTKPRVNPRMGFSYDVTEDRRVVLRGGTGWFTGRIPFLWYAYANYISGTRYFNVDVRPNTPTPIVNDVSALASDQPQMAEINLIDNDFNLPRDWKSSIAVDGRLSESTVFTVEATYSKVLDGLLFQSINRKDSVGTFSGADQRPYYLATGNQIKINPAFTNVFLLTNTDEGYRYTLTASVTKTTSRYDGYAAYTYGVSRDVTSFVRNSHAANFEWNQAVVANDPGLAFSNFDLRHKIVSYHFYSIPLKRGTVRTGVFFNSRSGSPFSFVYAGDLNRDGSSRNDLVYIPADASEIVLVPVQDANGNEVLSAEQQWQDLDAYIENDAYLSENRGRYAERNGPRTPWNHQVDLRFSYERLLGANRHRLELSLDLFNVANLLNTNWGKQHFVPNVENSSFSLLEFKGIVDGTPTFQFINPEGTPWQIDPLASRWQAQVSVKYSF